MRRKGNKKRVLHAQHAVDVVPCIALKPGGRHMFSYRVPGHLAVTPGALVRIPFGPRFVSGVVWRQTTAKIPLKDIKRVIQPALLQEHDRAFLEQLAEYSLESLAALTHACVSVRRHALMEFPEIKKKKRKRAEQTIVWGDIRTLPDHIRPLLKRGSVLVLVPELAIGRAAHKVCEHADLPVQFFAQTFRVTQRRQAIHAFLQDTPAVIIATHSGIFLPMARLGGIVVLEASLPSHRQWDLHPRYDARVAATLLASLHRVPVIYTSSLLSFDLDALSSQPSVNVQTSVRPFDLHARLLARRPDQHQPLLPETEHIIRETIRNGASVFLFHDILGPERRFVCDACGYELRCTVCGEALHNVRGTLHCRACGLTAGQSHIFCGRCGSPRIRPRHIGTQAIADACVLLFPGVPVLRLDRESLPHHKSISVAIPRGSIVIGTERAFAVLENITFGTTVLVNAESLLFSSAYDAGEHFLRMLGRMASFTLPPHASSLIIQTSSGEMSVIESLEQRTIQSWMHAEQEDRRFLLFPPHASLIQLTRTFPTKTRAETMAETLARTMEETQGVRTGWRVRTIRHEIRADVIVRGSRAILWKILSSVPAGWSQDPFVPLNEMKGPRVA